MDKNTPLIISVTGWSGSGKTTFCERLISELLERGFRVSAAKNSHRSLETDKAGSDSRRFFEAGAESVCLNAENSMTIFYKKPLGSDDLLAALFANADFIVAEGFRTENSFNIEITGQIEKPELMKNQPSDSDLIIYADEDFAAELQKYAGDFSVSRKTPRLIHRDDISAAADAVCRRR